MSDRESSAQKDDRKQLGRWGEDLAANHLTSAGCTILARNWRTRHGEIDIIARDGESIAFVEVKTRRGTQFGLPEEALTPAKATRLTKLAQAYISEHELYETDWRIDLIAVQLDSRGRLLRLEHIPNAVLGW
jgi:putative endonuclease